MATEPDDWPVFEFGAFRLDPRERLCLRDGHPVPLTPKAFDLLVYLVERQGHLVEKPALLNALWPNTIVEEANLAYTVSALRKVLDDHEDGTSVIQTVPTRGYRFVARVKILGRGRAVPHTQGEAVRLGLPALETLAERLARSPLPLDEALAVGVDIAHALEAAHGQGIIHLALTPNSVLLAPEGVRLLNFERDKATAVAGSAVPSTVPSTGAMSAADGANLGALPYMAPEQVQNLQADERTDVYALGAILFQMASGRQAFEGTTPPSLIAKILESEPPAVSTLVPLVPPAFDHVVKLCLAKQPNDRWQTAHDVKLQLQWIQAEGSRIYSGRASPIGTRRTSWLPWAGATALVAAAATILLLRPHAVVTREPPLRFELVLPPEMRRADYNTGTISPDGRRFVFEATVDGRPGLVLRDMSSGELRVLDGTQGALNPFWSPDSQTVAFFDIDGHLKQIAVTGRPIRVLAKTTYTHGSDTRGTWGAGVILYGSPDGRIYRVPETGGAATALDTLPWKAGQRTFESPNILPDGRHFLVSGVEDRAVYIASLDVPGLQKIMEDGAPAAYAAGHLYYSRGTGVFVRPFDPRRLAISGNELQVMDAAGDVSVSAQGTIVYRPEQVALSRLTWFDRGGLRGATVGQPGPYDQLLLSPGGQHATVVQGDTQGNHRDLWDVDLTSGIFTRLTTDPADDTDPSWSPDERSVVFTSWRAGRAALFVKDLTTGKENPLVPFGEPAAVDQWTPDGRFVIFRTFGKAVYALPISGDRTPRLLADTPFIEDEVHVSPDGRWVAFHADESGRWEVYLAAFPGFTSKRQISRDGGVQPQWRADGQEMFYLAPDGSMVSVGVDSRTGLPVSPPSLLFATRIQPDPFTPQYGVTADGKHFLGLERPAGSRNFTVLLNWLDRR